MLRAFGSLAHGGVQAQPLSTRSLGNAVGTQVSARPKSELLARSIPSRGASAALCGLSLSAGKGKPAGHWYACRRYGPRAFVEEAEK